MAYDSYVRVAPDSTGKYVRNLGLYIPIDLLDGTGPQATLVQQQVVNLSDPWGKVVETDLHSRLDQLIQIQERMLDMLGWSHGVDVDAEQGPQRLWGWAGLPTKAEQAQPVPALGDRFGRLVVLPQGSRDLVGTQTTTISASTSETTIVTAGGGFNDLVLLIISNTSASTNTRIDFRDTTAGTVLFSLQSVGGAAPVGFALPVPIPQTTSAQNWTAQCATSTTDIRVYAVFVKNK